MNKSRAGVAQTEKYTLCYTLNIEFLSYQTLKIYVNWVSEHY